MSLGKEPWPSTRQRLPSSPRWPPARATTCNARRVGGVQAARRRPLWLGALLVLLPQAVAAQFSPGALSQAHAALDGAADCRRCHELRETSAAERCLDCHRELAARITAGRGFHGLMDAGQRQRCGTCHAEHRGRDTGIVAWPGGRDEFDHKRAAGFALEGRHASLHCQDCHKPDLVRAADVRAERCVKAASTYLGLSTRCADCHRDVHQGQFAREVEAGDCATCHSNAAWKPVDMDHARTRFPLSGKHARLACTRCHYSVDTGGARVRAGTPASFVRYRPLAFGSCTECHTDAHHDRYGRDCARCHTPAEWKKVTAATFDHNRTRFSLAGKHTGLVCAKCHYSENEAGRRVKSGTPGSFLHYRPLDSGMCSACHADPHRARYGQDCTRCHSTSGWNDIATGAFDHDRTRYALRGLHRRVDCKQCHRGGDFKRHLDFEHCRACHAEAHGGQLAQRAERGACESCHTVEGFAPARFGPAEHQGTRFPLREAHLAVACNACHPPTMAGAPRGSISFRYRSRACAVCHADPHAGQFSSRQADSDCARCHSASSWQIAAFDHQEKTRFTLDGAHARAPCAACHRQEPRGDRRLVRYKPLDTACRSCHAEPRPGAGRKE